jgi:hypothetical protein
MLDNKRDWRTEMEMDGDAFNTYLKHNSLDIYSPPTIANKAFSLTKPETNIQNTFSQDYESSASAGDDQDGIPPIQPSQMIEETNTQLRQTVAKLETEKTHLVKMLMWSDMGEACGPQIEDILDSNYDDIDGLLTLKEESFTNTFKFGGNTAGSITEEGIWEDSYPVQINRG